MTWLKRIQDLEQYLNPVLVKEVRQALRSKRFRGSFGFTVMAGLIVAISVLLANASSAAIRPVGGIFFVGTFSCLAVAVLSFVPLNTFNSMGAEFEENTFDMLVISRLKPRQIILGKLLASGALALMHFSAFGFFIVFAFLFGGIDPTVVFFSLPALAVLALTASSLALCLSSLSQKRMVRVTLTLLLAAICLGLVFGTIGFVMATTERGIDLTGDDELQAIVFALVAAITVTSLSLGVGASRLAHPEENRSTSLRVGGFVAAMLVLGWGVWAFQVFGQVELLFMAGVISAMVTALVGSFFATERETLGRRVSNTLPRSLALRALALPWLPGGARGFLWVVMTFGAIGAVYAIATANHVMAARFGGTVPRFGIALASVLAYLVIYTQLFAGLFPNWKSRPKRMLLNRAMAPILLILGIVVPNIYGFLIQNQELAEGLHLGNPFWSLLKIVSDEKDPTLLFLAAGVVLVLQLFRVMPAIKEVMSAPRTP
jgi:hypothetical protein